MKRSLLLIFCAITLTVNAQPRLSLTNAINTALKNSYDIQIAKNNVEINVINNNIGIAGALPSVSATGTDNEQLTTINQQYADATRDTKKPNVASNNLALGVTGSILLYNGFRVYATKRRLEELQKQSQYQLNSQIQNTIAGVITKYFDVVRQQSYLKTISQSIDVSQKKLEILQTRKDVGLSNNADLYQAQLDLNALKQTKEAQQLVIDQDKTDLLKLIFVRPDSAVVISDTIIIDRNIKLEDVRNSIINNPDFLSADEQIHINEQIEKETAAQRYPTVRASTGYNLSSSKSAAGFTLLNQSYGPFVGLSVSIPIYNGGIFKRQQQIAVINTRNSKIQKDNVGLSLDAGVIRTYQAYINSMQQLKAEQDNYNLAKQLQDLVLQRFQLGQATIIDVRVAQQTFEDEGYRLINLSYAAKIAEVELKRISSQLGL